MDLGFGLRGFEIVLGHGQNVLMFRSSIARKCKAKLRFHFHRAKTTQKIAFSSTESLRLFITYFGRDSKATTNRTNVIMSDIRRIVGSVVHAKAIHVTNEAECGRRYRRNKSTKLVQGHVAEVHNGLSRTGRSQCFLTCDFDFGLCVSKRKKLNIRSVKWGPPPVAANSEIPAQNPQNSEINAADAIEAAATNLNVAGNATINRPVPTAPAAPSNLPPAPSNSLPAPSNSPPAPSNTTHDASVRLPTPTAPTAAPPGTTPPTPQPASALPVSENHGTRWFKLEDPRLPIGPPVPNQQWGIRCPATNENVSPR